MAKTLKFRLTFDGYPIRTLEDLQEHFCMEDALECYNNKKLHEWLLNHGFDEEYQKVNSLSSNDPAKIIKELMTIFHIECDGINVEKQLHLQKEYQERQTNKEIAKNERETFLSNMSSYFTEYKQLTRQLFSTDPEVRKQASDTIAEKYLFFYEMDLELLIEALDNLGCMVALLNNHMLSRRALRFVCSSNVYEAVRGEHEYGLDRPLYRQFHCSSEDRDKYKKKFGINVREFDLCDDKTIHKGELCLVIYSDYSDSVAEGLHNGIIDRSYNYRKHRRITYIILDPGLTEEELTEYILPDSKCGGYSDCEWRGVLSQC